MTISSTTDLGPVVRAWAPGRVNLIGDHTDYTGGLALPIALELGTTVEGVRGGDRVELTSGIDDQMASVPLDIGDPSTVYPPWARYVAGVVEQMRPAMGFQGTISTSLPVGAGLSSSAALEIAVALAIGFEGEPIELARLAQAAEHRAVGVPCGIMDQLASVFGREGHALLLDCRSQEVIPVPIHEGVDIIVLDGGETRQLATAPYGERRADCVAIEAQIGPLRDASLLDLGQLRDDRLRRRARHVISENERVSVMAAAIRLGDWEIAGEAMGASHRSLQNDFEVSTPTMDALVTKLFATPGVYGARLTGAGFGGCVVALTEPGALPFATPMRPADGARLLS